MRQHTWLALVILGEDKLNETGVSACGPGLVTAGRLYSAARAARRACGLHGHTEPALTGALSSASRSAVSILKSSVSLPLNLQFVSQVWRDDRASV